MGPLENIRNWFFKPAENQPKELLMGVEHADAVFGQLAATKALPGLSATIAHHGETVLQKGYGWADINKASKIDPALTLFRVASISKCITGLAFGKMVEQGLLGWDDSIYDHVPYFPKKKWDFTLRQLASHQAGIRPYRGKEFGLDQALSIKQGIGVFQEDPLLFEPGMGYQYNSFDFVLLALAMQEAAGMPFEEYVKQEVLLPLDMRHTLTPKEIDPSNAKAMESALFYTKRSGRGFREAIPVDNFYKLAGGGYLATSADIAKLGQAVLAGKLLRSDTYAVLFEAGSVNGRSTYYGLGFQSSFNPSGFRFVGHVGNSVGAYTNFFVFPDQGVVVSLLINCSDPGVQKELNGAIDSVLQLFNSHSL
ncbi:MAG: beta-lactamase family protein [Flavobacteriaceae bacterium]|nr:beta-lactamase family protein [Flavobacteriaceae bacterium]